ncbi:MAG: hypothetical protein EOP34_03375 [Rickettsiales bacterium]|nr:MAG: hypothetical protein EOP34_03375 [Rickettsiales bacterium]
MEKNSRMVTPTYSLQNVVVSYDSGLEYLNLQEMASLIPYGKIDSDLFAALQIKLKKNPSATHLIFKTGNNVCIGTKSILQSLTACRLLTHIMLKHNVYSYINNFRVINLVVNFALPFHVNLREFAEKYSAVLYEPNIFCAGRYKVQEEGISLLVYPDGKVVLTGSPNINTIEREIQKFCDIIINFAIHPLHDENPIDHIDINTNYINDLDDLICDQIITDNKNISGISSTVLHEISVMDLISESVRQTTEKVYTNNDNFFSQDVFFSSITFLEDEESKLTDHMSEYCKQLSIK